MDRDDRVADILADWRERRDRGEPVGPEDLVRAYPDLEDDLLDAFEAMDLAEAALTMPDAPGKRRPERIGRYRILDEIGSGGMGTVYLARAEGGATGIAAGERVAVKVIHPDLLRRTGFFKRFLREAEAGRRVRHVNVVRTLDADAVVVEEETVHFLVMEHVEGRTLAELLRDLGTVPEALVREIARQMATGLTAIHAAGIVHRDLKPENAIITDDRRVRIMDLGIARLAAESIALTRDGQFAGTLSYAAPEQFRGTEVGPSADLYALGVLLYELATGANPFRRDDAAGTMHAHLTEVPPRAEDVASEVSPFLSELLATLLAKDPSDRFSGSEALLGVLGEGEASSWWAERKRALDQAARRLPRVPVRRETRLHGREGDLALLAEAFRRVETGEGGCILVEGEAGIGKSRLVDAFLSGLDGGKTHVLYGSYPPSGGRGGLSDAILAHFGGTGLSTALRPYLAETPTLVPAFAALLSGEAAPSGAAEMSGEALPIVFCHLMRGLADEKPLVWVAEDLHFADPDSRSILLSLARAVEGRRVLLLLTTRPGLPEEELARFSRLPVYRRTGLSRLSAREVILLLEDAFRSGALADKLGGRIAKKSDGVPFFVFEMIRGLKEGQFITELPDGSYFESKVIEQIDVPSAVRDLIEARLAGLSREDRALLDVGAVHGFEFDPDLVGRTLGRPRVGVLQALADIERRSGVVRSSGAAYRFDHHQIQEVVYEELPIGLREEYHRLSADAFADRLAPAMAGRGKLTGEASSFLARHYLEGGSPDHALPHLLPALEFLRDSSRNEALVDLADLALACPGLARAPDRVNVMLARADALRKASRLEAALAALSEAVDRAEEMHDVKLEVRSRRELASCLCDLSRYEESLRHARMALAASRETGDVEGEARATVCVGNVFSVTDRPDEARIQYETALDLARKSGDPRCEMRASSNLASLLYRLDRLEEAETLYSRGLAIAREIGDRSAEAWGIGSLAQTAGWLGRHEESDERFERCLALCREIGDRRNEAFFAVHRADLVKLQGRYAETLDGYGRWLAFKRETGERYWEAGVLLLIGEVKIVLGDLEGGEDDILAGRDLFREIDLPHMEVDVLRALGELAAVRGDARASVDAVEKALAVARDAGEAWKVPRVLLALGRVRALAGATDAALAALDEGRRLSEETGDTGNVLVCAAHRAVLDGDAAPALAALGEREGDLDHHERTEVRFLLWQVTGDPAHLEEAHRLLRYAVDHAPERYRESMIARYPLHRDIAAAWEEHGGNG